MEPGDLIFYGGHDNGRFLGIYHVAVYVGNGEVVEASGKTWGCISDPENKKSHFSTKTIRRSRIWQMKLHRWSISNIKGSTIC